MNNHNTNNIFNNNDNYKNNNINNNDINSVKLVGILAVICGDGSCLILKIPDQNYIQNIDMDNTIINNNNNDNDNMKNNNNNNNINTTHVYDNMKVISEKSVLQIEIKVENNPILSLIWNPHVQYQLLCGMYDGSITVWNIENYINDTTTTTNNNNNNNYNNSSNVNSNSNNNINNNDNNVNNYTTNNTKHIILSHPSIIYTDITIDNHIPTVSSINTIKYCPYHPHLFVTGGYDGIIKVYIKSIYCIICNFVI
jgi:hypothetical protein